MKPIRDNVLIRELKNEKKTESGIILPLTEKEYEVIDVGEGCKALKKGDVIRLYDHAKKYKINDMYLTNESVGIKVVL